MKKIIILILSVVMIYGCDKYKYYDIPKNERPLFNKGDTFYYYSSQTQQIDTIIVTGLLYSYNHYDYEEYESVFISFALLSHKEKIIKINCTYPNSYFSYFLSCSYDSCRISYDYIYIDNIISKRNMTILNKEYNAYNLFPTQDSDTLSTILLPAIFYTKPNGILGYKYSDSTTYLIINPIE